MQPVQHSESNPECQSDAVAIAVTDAESDAVSFPDAVAKPNRESQPNQDGKSVSYSESDSDRVANPDSDAVSVFFTFAKFQPDPILLSDPVSFPGTYAQPDPEPQSDTKCKSDT